MYDNEYVLEHLTVYEYLLYKIAKETSEEQEQKKKNTKS